MTLSSVDRTLEVLDILVDRGAIGVTELATKLCVSASTAHRILETLLTRNYVVQDPESKRYQPGPRMRGLSYEVDLIERSRTTVARVGMSTAMTVHLSLLDGCRVRYVHAWSPTGRRAIGSRVGTSMYAHATAAGKALLSMESSETLLRFYPEVTLPTPTPASIRDRRGLFEELYAVRGTGCARNLGESERGVIGYATPVPAGRHRVALTVSAWATDLFVARGSEKEKQITGMLSMASSRLENILTGV